MKLSNSFGFVRVHEHGPGDQEKRVVREGFLLSQSALALTLGEANVPPLGLLQKERAAASFQ